MDALLQLIGERPDDQIATEPESASLLISFCLAAMALTGREQFRPE